MAIFILIPFKTDDETKKWGGKQNIIYSSGI